jgi:plastocyanin
MNTGTSMTAVLSSLFAMMLGSRVLEIDKKIDIDDQGYIPATIEITEGQKVMWANMTEKDQSVVSATMISDKLPEPNKDEKPLFDSGPIRIGGTFERIFETPGTFEYFSRKDPSVRGTIIVKRRE